MGVWEWNIPRQLVMWSPAVEHIHGIPPGSFAGTVEAQRNDMHPDDRERVTSLIERALAERCDYRAEYRIIRPDGEVRWLEAHGRLVLDEGGAPSRLIGVCRDVTEQKEIAETRARMLSAEAASVEMARARQRLSQIVESISEPFSVLDQGLAIVFVNEAAAKLGGFLRNDVLGKDGALLFPASSAATFRQACAKVLQENTPVVSEEYDSVMDRWWESSVFPLEHGVSVYMRDITQRKKAEELRARLASYSLLRADVSAALAAEQELRAMLARCCEAMVRVLGAAFARVWTADDASENLLLQASAGMYTHIDGPHAVVPVGKFKIGLIAEERSPHLTNDVDNDPRVGDHAWATREQMVSFAGYPLLVDGALVGVMAMFARRALPDDALAALAGVADTIAQGIMRRRAEESLEAKIRDLARSNAELEQFAYVASHDLQEPLRMVASYNQLIARRYKGKLDADADDFIGFTVEGVTRMQRLINDLLAYSRVGSQKRKLSDVDTALVLKHTLTSLERAIDDEKAVVTFDPLPHVTGDEVQLGQLFQNLVGNAIKFHAEAPPHVHISSREEGAFHLFRVVDDGIGIEEQYFDRIFVIFQRLHAREDYPGTGIGLSVCKKIVEKHGGKIWVESTPGKGTTVSFTLPSVPRAESNSPRTS